MTKIFISYRRDDSAYVTDTVYEHMARHFGSENVFLDVGSIPMGVDFRQYLSEQVAAHDVMLVMIGPAWANIMRERAKQANDFVRIEIESALQQNKFIIPVLVMNATMPDFSELPESIGDLQWRNSATVRRQPDLENDCNRIAQGIRQYSQSTGLPTFDDEVVSAPVPLTSSGTIRQKPEIKSIMPRPFEWIEIPDKGYSIAKYPITNAQYSLFLASRGYYESKWWTEFGWRLREQYGWFEPRYWQDSRWNSLEHPVVGISWYEAVAFCVWLSDITGEPIMLPTDEQWLFAARGNDEIDYPWGNEWNCGNCNNSVHPCHSRGSTSVNKYESRGASLFGVADMAGNVSEWSLTHIRREHRIVSEDGYGRTWESKANNIHLESPSDSGGWVEVQVHILLHGSSWHGANASDYKCDHVRQTTPETRDNQTGFRIARTPNEWKGIISERDATSKSDILDIWDVEF